MKNFFKTKGYYIVLLVCIVATCVGGIVALQRNADKDDDTPILAYNTATPARATASPKPTATDLNVMNPVTPAATESPDGSSPAPTATPAPIKMNMPIQGDTILGYAADKLVYNKTLQEWRTHKGLDIAGEVGATVQCVYVGTVKDIKYDPRFGDTIIVDHGAGLQTVYCGVKASENIEVGHAVEAGNVLGTITGDIFCEKEDAPHIHFEILQDGKNMNPDEYLEK